MLKTPTIAALFMLLSGCVYYYYPEPAATVYTDPGAVSGGGHPVVEDFSAFDYSASVASSAYYPWWSLDYFYLGHGYGRSSFSVGFGYGYPYFDHYYPWYGYPAYDWVWYAPYPHHAYHHRHRHHHAWHQPYWHDRYRRQYYRHYAGHDADYAYRHGGRRHSDVLDPDYGRQARHNTPGPPTQDDGYVPRRPSQQETGALSRHVVPDPASSDPSGMAVRSRVGDKPGRSRLHPAEPVASPGESRMQPFVAPVEAPATSPPRPVRSTGTFSIVSTAPAPSTSYRVRYAGSPKEGRTRTDPVSIGGGSMLVSSPPPRTSQRAPVSGGAYAGLAHRTQVPAKGVSSAQVSPAYRSPAPAKAQPVTRLQPAPASRATQPRYSSNGSSPPPRSARPGNGPGSSRASHGARSASSAGTPGRVPDRGANR